jgi:phosphoribosyl 1,2-cyclic phosphodiesterase
MNLEILGSSSKGNCYLLKGNSQTLIIEAGIKLSSVKKSLNFDLSAIAGVILSHSHLDHARYAREYGMAGIKVFSNNETLEKLNVPAHRSFPLEAKVTHSIGEFRVMPFPLLHDVPIFGYLIEHHECGKVLFVTDTFAIPFKFPGLNQVMIETNYSMEIATKNIESGASPMVRNRVLQSHLEVNTVCEFLRPSDLRSVTNIVLMHLSAGNSDAKLFKKMVEGVAPGKTVTVADKEISIPFDKIPF